MHREEKETSGDAGIRVRRGGGEEGLIVCLFRNVDMVARAMSMHRLQDNFRRSGYGIL